MTRFVHGYVSLHTPLPAITPLFVSYLAVETVLLLLITTSLVELKSSKGFLITTKRSCLRYHVNRVKIRELVLILYINKTNIHRQPQRKERT